MALVLSVLLVGSAVTPALAVSATPTADAPVSATETTAVAQQAQEATHPARSSNPEESSVASSSATDRRFPANGAPRSESLPENATTTEVTLVTGQTVTVAEVDNRTRYHVEADVPMQRISTDNETYIYPESVDFGTFDRNLFNVDFLVEQNLTDEETDSIPVIVSEKEKNTDDGEYFTASADGNVDVLSTAPAVHQSKTLSSVGAAAGDVPKSNAGLAFDQLAASDDVGKVSLDVKYNVTLDEANKRVSAGQARTKYNVSGEGIRVAVVDTGIDQSHPDLKGSVVAQAEFVDDGTSAVGDDRYGHGTHVAGIIAGDGTASGGKYTGIAPKADLIDAKACSIYQACPTSAIIQAMDYGVDQNADIISMSLGGPPETVRSNDPYRDAVQHARDNNVTVVVSAGNEGPGYSTVGSPGIHKSAITVGASDKYGNIAEFSSRGPTPAGMYLKPDLVAPGVRVMSAASSEAGYDSDYVSYSGTSMAAPVVSGTAALMLQAHDDWTPSRVKSAMVSTADPLGSQDVYTQGAGRLNAAEAIGTNVVVEPGTVDFGTYSSDTNVSKNLTVRNLGETETTLNTTVAVRNIAGDSTAKVELNKTSLTLAPGESADVKLMLDTNVEAGIYSGRVEFGDQYQTIFGFVRASQLTIQKSGINGTSTDGDDIWLFAENEGPFSTAGMAGLKNISGDTATYTIVSPGKYNVLTDGLNEDTGRPIVVSRKISVTDDTTIALDESNTVKYTLDTSAIDESVRTRMADVTVRKPADELAYIMDLRTGASDTTAVRFSKDADLNVSVHRLLTAGAPDSAEATSLDASSLYYLVNTDAGVTGPKTTSVDESQLARKNVTYYRANRSATYNVSMTAIGGTWFDTYYTHSVEGSIGDTREQTIYLSPRPDESTDLAADGDGGLQYHSMEGEGSGGEWSIESSLTLGPVPEANETMAFDFNRHPFVPHVNAFFSDASNGAWLNTIVNPQSIGGPELWGYHDSATDRIRVYRNGDLALDAKTTDAGFLDFDTAKLTDGDDATIEVVSNNDATPLSTKSVTDYGITYTEGGDNRPPMLDNTRIESLNANHTVTRDTVTFRFQTHWTNDPDMTADVWMSPGNVTTTPFEDDAGWTKASVERVGWDTYEATLRVENHTGRMNLALRLADAEGNTVENTVFDAFRVENTKPSVSVTGLAATSNPSTVEDVVRTTGPLHATATASDSPIGLERAAFFLSANFTSYGTWLPTTYQSGEWVTSANLSTVPDDGNYTLYAVGIDKAGNWKIRTADSTVVVDRGGPDIGATLGRENSSHGSVTVTSDEELASKPTATVTLSNGTQRDVSLRNNATREWAGTFELSGDGGYNVTATGTDLTGNTGTGTSSANLSTVSTENNTVTVKVEGSGLFIQFETDTEVKDTFVTVTSSRSELAPLSPNLKGINFLNGQLGSNLRSALDTAMIGIPVNESQLPEGVSAEQANISYYNESAGNWELQGTTIRKVTLPDGTNDTYWTTNVTHFSTYGAVADDQTAPTLETSVTPDDTLGYGTPNATVEFNYTDDMTGVNASAVELHFEGTEVTSTDAATITSKYATYNASLDNGETYNATAVVVDEAGNRENYTTQFSVEGDTKPPKLFSVSPGNGAEFDGGTSSVTINLSFTDDRSGVEPGALRAKFDGANVLQNASIGNGTIGYKATGLSSGDHKFEVYLEDEAGNGKWHTLTFTVGSASSGGGGGGGGGGGAGGAPPPAIQEEILKQTASYAKVEITNARSGNPGRVSFGGGGLAGGDATFRGLTVKPDTRDAQARFFVEAEASSSAPSGVSAFEDAGQTLGYLTLTPTYIRDSKLGTVGVKFGVDASMTDAPKNVALYQYEEGTWSAVETKVRNKQGGSYRFYAPANSTGTFAVGLDSASFEVSTSSLNATEVTADEAVAVTATVENVGSGEGTHTVELTVDGEVVASEDVTLASGESASVEFVRTFSAGDHEIAVGSATAGTLSVSSATTEKGMSDDRDEQTKGGSSGSGIPGFGLPAALVALLGALLLARRRE
ncbi:S8 family serine peptidase [Halorussus lipolyticus]|uniref:S8 family serine peptidase n=1 Tax=Halorussus lipolyticus TaxID=3034024 RepID=UPI0023E8B9EE|nr:S8 family serine peptidase [Halorussus sp. DT80]